MGGGRWCTYGRSAMEAAQSEICSRWASRRAMTDMRGSSCDVCDAPMAEAGVNKRAKPSALGLRFSGARVSEAAGASASSLKDPQSQTTPLVTHLLPRRPSAPSSRILSIRTSATMAESMEGVVTEGEQPKPENVEQQAIAGMYLSCAPCPSPPSAPASTAHARRPVAKCVEAT